MGATGTSPSAELVADTLDALISVSMYLTYALYRAGNLEIGQKHQSSRSMCLPVMMHMGSASLVVGLSS